MKATINEHGKLSVQAETPLESYALDRWAEDNFFLKEEGITKTENIIINVGFK